tara:strand:- start:1254 stop:1919 length:666 start_codon:yes stop_codon:yes gene_type:complete
MLIYVPDKYASDIRGIEDLFEEKKQPLREKSQRKIATDGEEEYSSAKYFDVLGSINRSEYDVAIIDKGMASGRMKMPFVFTEEIADIVEDICSPKFSDGKNAKNIYHWMCENLKFGFRYLGETEYRNSSEVLDTGEGVCGETAALYNVMARSVGINSSFVRVDVDYRGRHVNHACSMIDMKGEHGPTTLVDVTYNEYDVNHKEITPWDDAEAFKYFTMINK